MLASTRRFKANANRDADTVADQTRAMWDEVDPNHIVASWQYLVPMLTGVIMEAQQHAGTLAGPYIDEALRLQNSQNPKLGDINPDGLVGTASDGRQLNTLLDIPAYEAVKNIGDGMDLEQALTSGAAQAEMITRTQVGDAYRQASHVAGTSRKVTTYVRALTPPSCSRCIILSGDDIWWKSDFLRHPQCKCVSIPITDDLDRPIGEGWDHSDLRINPGAYFDSLSESEQNRIFTVAGAEAIRDGADMNRVVNARRKAAGLSGPVPEGRKRRSLEIGELGQYTTRELSLTGSRGQRLVRLMPEAIYARAGTHEEAIRLLRLHGYIL